MKKKRRVTRVNIFGADGSVVFIWNDTDNKVWKIRKASRRDLDLNVVNIDFWDSLRDAVDDGMGYIEYGN